MATRPCRSCGVRVLYDYCLCLSCGESALKQRLIRKRKKVKEKIWTCRFAWATVNPIRDLNTYHYIKVTPIRVWILYIISKELEHFRTLLYKVVDGCSAEHPHCGRLPEWDSGSVRDKKWGVDSQRSAFVSHGASSEVWKKTSHLTEWQRFERTLKHRSTPDMLTRISGATLKMAPSLCTTKASAHLG